MHGTVIHHANTLFLAVFNSVPMVLMPCVSPNPKKLNPLSVNIIVDTFKAHNDVIEGQMLGRICFVTTRILEYPKT